MRWVAWLLWNPLHALDLVDGTGRPDHGKLIGFLAASAFFVALFLDRLPSLGHTIAIAAVAFGWPAFRTFLAARTATVTETVTRDEAAVERARHPAEPDLYHDDERGEP